VPVRESLVFHGRGEAVLGLVDTLARVAASQTRIPLVVVEPAVGAIAPSGNSSAEWVPASSSPEAATPASGEPFVVTIEFTVGSGLA
jgi:hypothetical protein